LLLTPGAANSIHVQAANQTSDNLPDAIPFTKANNASLTDVIKTYIESSTLNTLYNSASADAPLTFDQIKVAIVEKYKNNAGPNIADKIMATFSGVALISAQDPGVLVSGPYLDNKPAEDIAEVIEASKANFETWLNSNSNMPMLVGGSRSRKHRRRHKQTKNTKRRYRK
jgi:hypothetical protein